MDAAGVHLDFEAEGLQRRLDPSVESTVFRVVQEAVHNIVKHARARNAWVRMRADNGLVKVSVEDDGQGFDVQGFFELANGTQSLGLLGMRERAELLGGTCSVTSAPGRGTRIDVEVPVAPSD
ncbi:MAG: hypothetical protein HY677_06480 [Chloroflexi bacterium]|nr:hypothetical protein [Chloroflexota bacterium]